MISEFSWKQLRGWIVKGGFAVTDQALFSGSNFILNILLARWLAPEEYGAFAVALSVFYLLAGLHTAVLTEPMMVFGSGKYRENFQKYLGLLLYGHCGISVVVALALGIAAFVFAHYGSPAMACAFAGLAVASPFLLLLWLVRRACYVPMKPVWATVGSGVNLVVTLVGLFLLWQAALLSSFSGLVLLAIAAVAASISLSFFLRPQVVGFAGNPTPAMVFGDHWGYGSWNLVGMLAYWASGQILIVLIPIFLGLAASAALGAVLNLYRPLNLVMQSIGLTILPIFGKLANHGSQRLFLRKTSLAIAVVGGIVALYGIIVTCLAHPLLNLLYAGSYDDYIFLIPIAAIWTTGSAVTGIIASALKVKGAVSAVPAIYAFSAFATLAIAIPLMQPWGLEGAAAAGIITQPVTALIAYLVLKRRL